MTNLLLCVIDEVSTADGLRKVQSLGLQRVEIVDQANLCIEVLEILEPFIHGSFCLLAIVLQSYITERNQARADDLMTTRELLRLESSDYLIVCFVAVNHMPDLRAKAVHE